MAYDLLMGNTKVIISTLMVVIGSSYLHAQKNPTKVTAGPYDDLCHVYVVDIEKARKAIDNFKETGNEAADLKKLEVGQTMFPIFIPKLGEEELTTKHYPFPNSKLIITASVYYTDESMASFSTSGKYEIVDTSMYIGIALSSKEFESALADETPNASIAEVTDDEFTNKIRAKQYVKIDGRMYLYGIECDCSAKREPELLKQRKKK